MAIIGWLFLLAVSIVLTFVSLAAGMLSSGFSGKIEGESIILFFMACVFWYFTISNMPFTISLN